MGSAIPIHNLECQNPHLKPSTRIQIRAIIFGFKFDPDSGKGQWRKFVGRGQIKEMCPKWIILEWFGNVESKCVITRLSLVHPISHPSTQFNCVYLYDTRLEPTTNRILHNAHRYFWRIKDAERRHLHNVQFTEASYSQAGCRLLFFLQSILIWSFESA